MWDLPTTQRRSFRPYSTPETPTRCSAHTRSTFVACKGCVLNAQVELRETDRPSQLAGSRDRCSTLSALISVTVPRYRHTTNPTLEAAPPRHPLHVPLCYDPLAASITGVVDAHSLPLTDTLCAISPLVSPPSTTFHASTSVLRARPSPPVPLGWWIDY